MRSSPFTAAARSRSTSNPVLRPCAADVVVATWEPQRASSTATWWYVIAPSVLHECTGHFVAQHVPRLFEQRRAGGGEGDAALAARLKSPTPSSCSSLRTSALTAGCATRKHSPTLRTSSSSATATKYLRCRSSIVRLLGTPRPAGLRRTVRFAVRGSSRDLDDLRSEHDATVARAPRVGYTPPPEIGVGIAGRARRAVPTGLLCLRFSYRRRSGLPQPCSSHAPRRGAERRGRGRQRGGGHRSFPD
jgi:hypothetical protein